MKSRIYVYRPISAGNGVSTSIISGNKLIGTTGANGFLCWEEEPGQKKILSKAENTDSINFLSIRTGALKKCDRKKYRIEPCGLNFSSGSWSGRVHGTGHSCGCE